MHPLELKDKWNLNYSELAIALGFESELSCRAWAFRKEAKRYSEPTKQVKIAAFLLDQYWQLQGKPVFVEADWFLAFVQIEVIPSLCPPIAVGF